MELFGGPHAHRAGRPRRCRGPATAVRPTPTVTTSRLIPAATTPSTTGTGCTRRRSAGFDRRFGGLGLPGRAPVRGRRGPRSRRIGGGGPARGRDHPRPAPVSGVPLRLRSRTIAGMMLITLAIALPFVYSARRVLGVNRVLTLACRTAHSWLLAVPHLRSIRTTHYDTRRSDALRLADPLAFAVGGRRLRGHRGAAHPGVPGRGRRLRRRLAHRAQLHRRGRLLRSDPVRERAGRAHLARAHRLRGDPARAPASHPPRRAARAARQPEPRAPGRGCRPRLALQRVRVRRLRAAQRRQPRAQRRGPRDPDPGVDRGALRVPRQVLPDEPARAAPARLPAAAPTHLAQRGDARLVRRMRPARRAHPDLAAGPRRAGRAAQALRGRAPRGRTPRAGPRPAPPRRRGVAPRLRG